MRIAEFHSPTAGDASVRWLAGWLLCAASAFCADAPAPNAPQALSSEKAGWVSEGRWPRGKEASLPTPKLQLARAQELERIGNAVWAAREYAKIVAKFPESAESEEGHLGAGRCHFLAGQFKDAEEQLGELRRRYPRTGLLDPASELEISIARGYLDGKGQDGDLPIRSRARKALRIFERIVKDDPMSRWADDGKFGMGLSHKAAGRYDQAIEQFKGLLEKYPHSDLRADAEAQIAECIQMREPEPAYTESEAAEVERRLAIAKEEAAARGQEIDEPMLLDTERILRNRQAKKKYEQALFYERNAKWQAAEVYLELIVKRYPGTEWAEKARQRLETIGKR